MVSINQSMHNLLTVHDRLILNLITECPWPVYRDTSANEDVCYFLFDNVFTMDYGDAKDLCRHYDKDATLAVLDTQAIVTHVTSSGVFDQTR